MLSGEPVGMSSRQPVGMASEDVAFQSVQFSINYETSFGQELWLIGSAPFTGNWDPHQSGGQGGLQASWTEGHNWIAELPYQKIAQDLERDGGRFEFKFVVK